MSGLMDKFFDLTLAMLCTARRDGNAFENLNPAWERTLGWSREELCSKSFLDFIHPDDVPSTFAVIAKMDEGAPAVHFENRYRHKDGSWVWLSWVSVLEGGTYYATAIDITPYKQALATLVETNTHLKHFAYAASHDLREPLHGISGHLSLIDSSGLDEQSQESLGFVRQGATRMQQLIDGLTTYARISVPNGSRVPVSMAVILQEATFAVAQSAVEAQAAIRTEGAMPFLSVDAGPMSQVFQNLLSNAIKYRKPTKSPVISVRSVPVDNGWRFEVEDDGVGFDPRYADRAFAIFQRLHPRSEYEGTGIGLAIVERVVQLHGGHVGIRSQLGQGTTAWFWLPETRADKRGAG
ncbi:MAG: PAS domain S-box protein [Myxococcales bacterium]|nr:PAS domain S-box protein [Myxococcales bacterium]